MKMKKTIFVLFCVMILAGCSSYQAAEPADEVYEADILIGQDRSEVLEAAEKVFGEPQEEGFIFADSNFEVEIRRYRFTNVSDFVMYFYRDVFVQAGLMPVDSPEYPALRADYMSIKADKPGPVLGYTIFMNQEEVVLDTIQP